MLSNAKPMQDKYTEHAEQMEIKSCCIWKSKKKCLNYDDLCSKMHLFQALFLDFQIQQLAISKPVKVEKNYVPQKKALKRAI